MTDINREVSKQKPFTYASLFSGVGGFEQALNKLGGTCVFASEFDKFAQQSYTALYGDDHLHGDITKIDEKEIPDHDLIVAGIPCQAFSVAGKRKGFDDTRGTLFFDVARIAQEKQPKSVIIENVKGLVNHDKGRTLDTMIQTLNDIGYVVDFDVLNSKFFGVPQNRERIFIVAVRSDLIEAEPFSEESTSGQTIVPKGKRRIGEWADVFNFDFPEQAEVTTRLRDILETDVYEKYYLDEEKTARLVKQLEALEINKQTLVEYDRRKGVGEIREEALCLSASDWRGLNRNQKQNAVAEPLMIGHVDIKGHDAIKRVYSADYVGPTLTTMGGGHREPKTAVSIGNPPKYRIRKLTPRECWRLQGFPDETHDAVELAGISDSQRYKQAGNAVTVNVIEAIGERLIPLIS